MEAATSPLRRLVDKWLAPTPEVPARVIRFSRLPFHGRRFVCVEVPHPRGAIAIFFFSHEDGSWCVFPPAAKCPEFADL